MIRVQSIGFLAHVGSQRDCSVPDFSGFLLLQGSLAQALSQEVKGATSGSMGYTASASLMGLSPRLLVHTE